MTGELRLLLIGGLVRCDLNARRGRETGAITDELFGLLEAEFSRMQKAIYEATQPPKYTPKHVKRECACVEDENDWRGVMTL